MKMTRLEKRFVNRRKKSEGNIQKLETSLKQVEIGKIRTVLELGCGIGFVSYYLAVTYNREVFAADFDEEQIQNANKFQPQIDRLSFQVEDATELSFPDSSIDLVVSQNVFHHIPFWERAVQEIAGVLRAGGCFIWLDLVFPQIVKRIFLLFVKNYGLYTIDDIKKTFSANGF